MKRGQAVKMALVLALTVGALSVGAAAFSHADPGFSVPVPDEWRAGRGDLLRPAIGQENPDGIISENHSEMEITIVDDEPEEEVTLFWLK